MESGDHIDADKLVQSEAASKHKQHGDFIAVENLQRSEQIASAEGHQALGDMENLLLHAGVPNSKGVSPKNSITEFLLHESGASVHYNELDHSQEQGEKSENLNTKFEEILQNDEAKQKSIFSSDKQNNQDSEVRIVKGIDNEISTDRNLEGKDVIANSAASQDDVLPDSVLSNEKSDQSKGNQLSQEISVDADEQVPNKGNEGSGKIAGIHLPTYVHLKVNDELISEENCDKENEGVVPFPKPDAAPIDLHIERSDIPAVTEKSGVPMAEKHVDFISHESDVKKPESGGIDDSESKGVQFIETEKVVTEVQKDDSGFPTLVNTLQGDSDSKPAVTENVSNLNTSDEQTTINDEKEEEWLDIVGSGHLMKKILRKAENEYRPQNSFICEINLEGRLEDGTVVEKYKNMKVQVGDFEVVQGIDLALPLMNVGEVALLEIGPRFAYGSLGNLPKIPPDAKMTYQIELLSAENEPEMESLSITERRKIGDKKRERGNWWYSRKEYSFAIQSYRRALEFLDDAEQGFSVEKKEVSKDTERQFQELLEDRLKVYNNLAATHIMNKSYDAALTSVENVLRCQPQNVKALKRKAKIFSAKGDAAGALAILQIAYQLEPDSDSIKQDIQRLQDVIKRDTKQEKNLYKKMLGQTKPSEKAVPKAPKVSYRTWGIVCSSVAVVLLGAVAYRYKFL